MNSQTIQVLLRRILRAVGVTLATRGILASEDWTLISGAIVTIAIEAWSLWEKVKAGSNGREIWVTFIQNSLRSVAYIFVTRGTLGSDEAELCCGLVSGIALEWWTAHETKRRAENVEARKEEQKSC